jgi:hypothetical protein
VKPVQLDTVVIPSQRAPDISLRDLLAPDILERVVAPAESVNLGEAPSGGFY